METLVFLIKLYLITLVIWYFCIKYFHNAENIFTKFKKVTTNFFIVLIIACCFAGLTLLIFCNTLFIGGVFEVLTFAYYLGIIINIRLKETIERSKLFDDEDEIYDDKRSYEYINECNKFDNAFDRITDELEIRINDDILQKILNNELKDSREIQSKLDEIFSEAKAEMLFTLNSSLKSAQDMLLKETKDENI